MTAEEIVSMRKRWDIKAKGVADDACFAKAEHSTGSIADEFARYVIRFQPAKRADCITGWSLMRRMLADAEKSDKAGLYVSRGCDYFWSTVPYLVGPAKPPQPA